MRFDLRAPDFGAPPNSLYRAALEMAEWADRKGFDLLRISEHHGAEDGYCPSPLVLAAAFAARTSRARVRINALLLPLHDPLRLAEDIAVLDLISNGRAEVLIGAGYRPSEFAMFGTDIGRRGRLVEEGVAILRQAWTGEPFEHRGHSVIVRPRPVQRPHPTILLGGSSPAAARRAARLGLDFVPTRASVYEEYRQARIDLGHDPGTLSTVGPPFVFVTDDPERLWPQLLPHMLHEANSYARWAIEGSTAAVYTPADAASIRAGSQYRVVTPAQCVDLISSLGDGSTFLLHPLVAGIDPDIAWSSLELFADQVLPHMSRT